jgi:hypothetical protein
MSRAGRATLVVALVLGFAVEVAPAAQSTEPAPGRQLAAAAKKKKCKKGKVRERVGKKTRCVRARKALPKPKATDMRKAGAKFLLGANFSKLRDRRGKRLPSLPKLLHRVHPRAEQALLAATNAGLAKLDRAQGSLARAAAAPCSGSGSISSTFNAGGGLSVDMTATAGPDASLQLGLQSQNGNRRVRFEVEFPACDENGSQIDSCPTADGIVRGRNNQRIKVRAVVLEGNTETWSQGITLNGETTFRGVVADDAKLDFMEPHNTEQATLTLGGSSRGFAPVTIRTLVQRITRVNMRTPSGEYVLGPSIIDVSISSQGFEGAERRATEAEIAGRMRAQADKQFADIIAKAIEKYRRVEDGWNQPNTCATVEFTPASNTRTLHLGDTGALGARVQAKPGGSPSGATWTLLSSQNAPFSPGSASSNPASFNYGAVADAGPGINVTGAFKAVSKAGVAQGTWTQPTENVGVNTIAGTFSGTYSFGGSSYSWTGSATFTRVVAGPGANGSFQLTSGSYTVTASGTDGTGASTCQQAGTKTVTTTGGDLTVTGQEPTRTPPYDYSGSVIGFGPEAMSMTVRLSNCPPGSELENKDVPIGLQLTALDTRGTHQSADGLDYSGISSQNEGPLSASWNWSMRGTP